MPNDEAGNARNGDGLAAGVAYIPPPLGAAGAAALAAGAPPRCLQALLRRVLGRATGRADGVAPRGGLDVALALLPHEPGPRRLGRRHAVATAALLHVRRRPS